jgi:hypothetical protein
LFFLRQIKICSAYFITYLCFLAATHATTKRTRSKDNSQNEKSSKRAKWTDELNAIDLEEEETKKLELEREKDLKERDDLAERLKKKDKDRTRNIVEKVCVLSFLILKFLIKVVSICYLYLLY